MCNLHNFARQQISVYVLYLPNLCQIKTKSVKLIFVTYYLFLNKLFQRHLKQITGQFMTFKQRIIFLLNKRVTSAKFQVIQKLFSIDNLLFIPNGIQMQRENTLIFLSTQSEVSFMLSGNHFSLIPLFFHIQMRS